MFSLSAFHLLEWLLDAACTLYRESRHCRSMFGRRAFSVARPVAWNSLPDCVRDPTRFVGSFCRDLKTFLFSLY